MAKINGTNEKKNPYQKPRSLLNSLKFNSCLQVIEKTKNKKTTKGEQKKKGRKRGKRAVETSG